MKAETDEFQMPLLLLTLMAWAAEVNYLLVKI